MTPLRRGSPLQTGEYPARTLTWLPCPRFAPANGGVSPYLGAAVQRAQVRPCKRGSIPGVS